MSGHQIIIFGVGGKFKSERKKYATLFEKMNIVAFFDNNKALQGTSIDGTPVMSPDAVSGLEYEKVILMADYVNEMRKQLIALGVSGCDIMLWDEYLCIDKHGVFIDYGKNIYINLLKERILLVSVELDYNGGTIAILNAAKALILQGYDVTVAAPDGNMELISEIKESVHIVLVPSIQYPQKEELEWVKQFDIVMVNTFHMLRCACVINGMKPVIWWIHESSEKYTSVYPVIIDNCQQFSSFDAMRNIDIMAVSLRAKNNFNRYYPLRVKETLLYGIPDTYIGQKSSISPKCVLAIIGVVVPIKAQLIFLDAVDMLDAELKEKAEFRIIGDCSKSAYADRVCRKAEKMPQVRIIGELTRRQMQELYGEVDIVVCASQEETMSLTVTEGMMHGKVCITTDKTGIADYIRDEINGLVCKAGSAESLYKKIKWVLEHPGQWKKLGENARKTYQECFTMEKFGMRLQEAVMEAKKGQLKK